jgi:hypothetical protein
MKGTHRFGIKGKLASRYIGPFRIVARRGQVAYKLELPPQFSHIHDVFHVSQLRKCFKESPHRAVVGGWVRHMPMHGLSWWERVERHRCLEAG